MISEILSFIVPVVIFLGFLEFKYMKNWYKSLYLLLFLVSIILKFQGIYTGLSFTIDTILFLYIVYFKISRIFHERKNKTS